MKTDWASVAVVGLVLLATAVSTVSANANENADYWDKVRVGGKLCFKDHEHYGQSPPWVSRDGARAAAIRQWENFTVMEYGRSWGSYTQATGKRMSCDQKGGRWTCETSARPCKG